MKKKIAVLGNAWSVEYLKVVLKGIRGGARDNNADVFLFLNYSVNGDSETNTLGEANIFKLSQCGDYDGYILLSNTFHLREEYDYLKNNFINIGKPVVSLEYNIPGLGFYGSDNYTGMHELCEHILDEHDVKNVMYISGPLDNEENAIRRKALEDVLSKRNLSLDEENVLVCNWNIADVEKDLPKWIKKHSYIPDAIVCANDMMAMGACNALTEAGYTVPRDVIVTGFDNLHTAEAFAPAIATVGRNWQDLGYKAVQYLTDKMNKKDVPDYNLVETKAIPSESCGCQRLDAESPEILAQKRSSYNNYISRANVGLHVCDLADTISKAVTEEQLCEILRDARWNSYYEGNEFYICLVNNFFSSLRGGTGLTPTGYTSEIDVIYGRKNDISYQRETIDIKKLIPVYDQESEESRIYVSLPLYGDEGCYGYLVFCDELSIMYDYSMYNWVRHMNMNLRHVRRGITMSQMNNRLERLSITDALTGVYNRMGCDTKAYPFLEKCHRQGKQAALMFADINKMKLINDNYGHIHGDIAIRTIAQVITDVLKDDWIVVRYGGDEFLMVGECIDDDYVNELLHKISEHLEEVKLQLQLPYNLKVSLGHVMVKPEETLNMSECLTRAENAMYVMKKRLHAEMKG